MTPAGRLRAAADTIDHPGAVAQRTATLLRTIAGYVEEADRLGLSVGQGDLTTSALALADDILTDAWVTNDAPLQLAEFDRNTQTREHPRHADTCPTVCPVCDGIIAAQDHT